MPALLDRVISAPSAPASPHTDASVPRTCSGCALTEDELRKTGLLGCARCYETFAALIRAAAPQLHGVSVPDGFAVTPPVREVTNPWPTRRAVPLAKP